MHSNKKECYFGQKCYCFFLKFKKRKGKEKWSVMAKNYFSKKLDLQNVIKRKMKMYKSEQGKGKRELIKFTILLVLSFAFLFFYFFLFNWPFFLISDIEEKMIPI